MFIKVSVRKYLDVYFVFGDTVVVRKVKLLQHASLMIQVFIILDFFESAQGQKCIYTQAQRYAYTLNLISGA